MRRVRRQIWGHTDQGQVTAHQPSVAAGMLRGPWRKVKARASSPGVRGRRRRLTAQTAAQRRRRTGWCVPGAGGVFGGGGLCLVGFCIFLHPAFFSHSEEAVISFSSIFRGV